MAGQVDGGHPVVRGQVLVHRAPHPAGLGEAVGQHQRRPVARRARRRRAAGPAAGPVAAGRAGGSAGSAGSVGGVRGVTWATSGERTDGFR